MRYLEVKFYDNDFGTSLRYALDQLYKWVVRNNAHCLMPKGEASEHFSDRTIPEIFIELHRYGQLNGMIRKLWALRHEMYDIEYKTRGLYWANVDWASSLGTRTFDDLGESVKRYWDCFTFDLEFHMDGKFSKEDRNGEHAYLDLITGEVKVF